MHQYCMHNPCTDCAYEMDYSTDLANFICQYPGLDHLEGLDHDLKCGIYWDYVESKNWRKAVLSGCQAVLKNWGTEFFDEKTLLASAYEVMDVERI